MVEISYGVIGIVFVLVILLIVWLTNFGEKSIKGLISDCKDIVLEAGDVNEAMDMMKELARMNKGIHYYMLYEIVDMIQKKSR